MLPKERHHKPFEMSLRLPCEYPSGKEPMRLCDTSFVHVQANDTIYECAQTERKRERAQRTWLPYCTNEKNVCTAQKEETDKNNVANITL